MRCILDMLRVLWGKWASQKRGSEETNHHRPQSHRKRREEKVTMCDRYLRSRASDARTDSASRQFSTRNILARPQVMPTHSQSLFLLAFSLTFGILLLLRSWVSAFLAARDIKLGNLILLGLPKDPQNPEMVHSIQDFVQKLSQEDVVALVQTPAFMASAGLVAVTLLYFAFFAGSQFFQFFPRFTFIKSCLPAHSQTVNLFSTQQSGKSFLSF